MYNCANRAKLNNNKDNNKKIKNSNLLKIPLAKIEPNTRGFCKPKICANTRGLNNRMEQKIEHKMEHGKSRSDVFPFNFINFRLLDPSGCT